MKLFNAFPGVEEFFSCFCEAYCIERKNEYTRTTKPIAVQ